MKRKTNKPISILLCIVMLISLIPMTAFADESRAVKITDEAKSEKVTDESKAVKITDESKAEKAADESKAVKITAESKTEKVTDDSNSSKITKDSDSEKITDEAKFISLEEAKEIALKDAELDRNKQKITFTKAELSRNKGRPCYLLDFYTGENQYHYEIDAKTGEIIYGRKYILLADAKKIAVDDAECTDRVTFLEEELVDGGIKTPYYHLVFADNKTQWTYRINAVTGGILKKKQKDIKVKPDIEWENPFGDVKKKDWFYFSVKFAYDFGLMKGTTEMEFSPDSYVTRAMFVMIIYRMEKEPQAGGSVFVDVEIGGYYDKAVAWANANGIVSGVSKDRFAPNDPITREQMATILYRYANFKGYDIESNGNTAYTDSDFISDYAKNAVSWAAANLLMKGNDDGSFLPNANTTRAQAAAVFTRMIENLE